MRLGARFELAGSGSPDAGLGVPRIAAATAPDTFLLRAGGLELDLAAEVGLVVPIATRP